MSDTRKVRSLTLKELEQEAKTLAREAKKVERVWQAYNAKQGTPPSVRRLLGGYLTPKKRSQS